MFIQCFLDLRPCRADLHYSALYTCNSKEKNSKIRTPNFEISARHLFVYPQRRDDAWNPAVMSLHPPPRHKWTASEWEERSRRPYLVSDSAGDASKPHKLLLNVCQWYRIGYCWIFNSLTVVWCHCLSAPVCLLAFSPHKYIHHTTHLSLEGERLGWWRKAAVKEA